MFNILNYPHLNAESYCIGMCGAGGIIGYLINQKIPEDIYVQSSTKLQSFGPSAQNRVIRNVYVQPITAELDVTPSTDVQTFTDGPYAKVTVQAES